MSPSEQNNIDNQAPQDTDPREIAIIEPSQADEIQIVPQAVPNRRGGGAGQVSEKGNEEEAFDLDSETLQIIGEEPPKNQRELELHSSLANRWRPWLEEGLKKEVRDDLLQKYSRAGTCSLEPPIINQELTMLSANILRKDRYFTFSQNLAGSALSALAPVISELLQTKTKKSKKMLENVWDAAKLLAEIHHSQRQ